MTIPRKDQTRNFVRILSRRRGNGGPPVFVARVTSVVSIALSRLFRLSLRLGSRLEVVDSVELLIHQGLGEMDKESKRKHFCCR